MTNLNRNQGKIIIAANQNVKERKFWIEKMSGDPVKSCFPYDFPKTFTGKPSFSEVDIRFDGIFSQQLDRLSNGSEPRLHMILMAGLILLLGKYTSKKDILVGAPVYKQKEESSKEYINTFLILRLFLREGINFKELLYLVRQTMTDAINHQNYPVEILPEQLKLPVLDNDFYLFDVALLLENIHDANYLNHIRFNMLFSFLKNGSEVTGKIRYNNSIYEEATVCRIAELYKRLLEKVFANMDKAVDEINLVDEHEIRQLLEDFNRTGVDYPRSATATLHLMFEEQVARTPHVIALVGQTTGEIKPVLYTYDQLNRQANQLARLIKKKGVLPGDIVGIMMDNSTDMVVAVFATLKAGATYLPINPGYPQKRILSMMNDSNAKMLITREVLSRPFSYEAFRHSLTNPAQPVLTPKRLMVDNLDDLQIPDRSYVDYEKYSPFIGHSMMKNSMTMDFSRGCIYNCAFCFKVWPTNKYIHRSAENLFQEIKLYYDMGVRRFSFNDDLPNFNIPESSKFYKMIINNGLKVHFYFPNGLRADLLTEEYIDLMVDAGTISLDLAIETTSPRLQKLLKKNMDLEKLDRYIRYIIDKYPHVIIEAQLVHGIPTETEAEARASLDYIKSLKWLHFPYVHVLKIFPGTDMARIAMENGITEDAIQRSYDKGYYQLPETLPFPKSFSHKYQSEFVSDYFLSRERLLHVIPHQMKVLTEDEFVQKHNSFLPVDIKSFADLLGYARIDRKEIKGEFRPDEYSHIADLNKKIRKAFPVKEVAKDAMNVLLLDISSYFSHDRRGLVYDVVEPPLGLMYLMTNLRKKFGPKINGKIMKSRVDFDSFDQLEKIINDFKPSVIGIRTMNFFKDFFHKTIALLRHWGVTVPIITGGPYASSCYQTLLKDEHVDLAVLGEGEVTLVELIQAIMENGGKLPGHEVLKNIKGIAYMKAEDKSQIEKNNREVLLLDKLQDMLALESGDNLGQSFLPTDPAYIIYTSGSTGKPKGIIVEHRNVVNLINWFGKTYHLQPGKRTLQLTDFTFDPSIEDIFGSLLYGATLHMADRQMVADREKFSRYVMENDIHIVNFIPTVLADLLNGDRKLENLQAVICGGESLDEMTKNQLVAKGYPLFNHYGPTEITVDALVSHCTASRVNLGYPIDNVRSYILDPAGRLLPPGIPGELCISGAGLARGYLNDPRLTFEKFCDNPFVPGDRLFKTGDIAVRLKDGSVRFMGRIDKQQIKLRGFRIELEDIRRQLIAHWEVKDAVVTIVNKNNDEKYLAAYVVLNDSLQDAEFDMSELRNYLTEHLPDYMVPTFLIKINQIPLTLSGKINYPVLLELKASTEDNYVPPRDTIEKTMVRLWSEVVNIDKDKIGIDTNFFELGGHSLKATVLVARIHKALNVMIPLVELFKTPTIRKLSEYARSVMTEMYCEIEPVEQKEYYVLSSAQRRIYLTQQIDPQSTAYNIIEEFVMEGKPDKERWENAFKKLLQRHESLRTSFHMIDGQLVQKIHNQLDFYIQYDDMKDNHVLDNFVKPFDLAKAPLCRAGLVQLQPDKYVMIVDLHHIISDGISHRVLEKDFIAFYNGINLQPLKLQYKDFAQWQYHLNLSEKIKKQENYWLNIFTPPIPILQLPTDFPRPSIQSFQGSMIHFSIDQSLYEALKSIALKQETTLYIVVLSIFYVLMSKLGGQEDIIIGSDTAGRRHADLENIIGMFVNTLGLRNYPGAEKRFCDFLKQVKDRTLDGFDNQDYQFDTLVNKIFTREDARHNPLFDVMYCFYNFDERLRYLGNENNSREKINENKPNDYKKSLKRNRTSMFDLTLHTMETPYGIDFTFEYNTKLFKERRIEKFISYFIEIINAIVENNQIILKDINISLDLITAKQQVNQVEFGF